MIKKQGAKIKLFQLFRLIGIVIFVVLLFKLDFNQIWHSLKNSNFSLFLGGLFLQIILLLIKASRWHILKKGQFLNPQLFSDFGIFMESYAIGVFTPGRVGEMLKAGYGDTKDEKWSLVYKVLSERGLDLGIFIFIACLAVLRYNIVPMSTALIGLILAFSFLLIVLSLVILSKNKIKNIFRNTFFKNKHQNALKDRIGFSLNKEQTVYVFGLSIFGNIVTFLSCYLLALSVSLKSSFLFVSGGVAVSGLLNLLPVTIMGIGTRELSFIYIFKEYDQSVVMAFSFLMFLVLQVGGGVISMLLGRLFMYLSKKYN
jgi:glycosyltransferase 2 family protein